MREIAMAFICFAGLMVIGSWALTITLAIGSFASAKSGKGILSHGRFLSAGRSLSAFSRQRKTQWLSAADTIAQYGGDHVNTTD